MIIVNVEKAKQISHEKRRESRNEEFRPHDEIIMKQIPGNNLAQAEQKRQEIRDKYATIQTQIDSANTVDDLYTCLESFKK